MSMTEQINLSEPQLSLGERIMKARKDAEMTRAELADRIHVGYQTVGKWERGDQVPDVNEARDVAMACGVPFGWLADVPVRSRCSSAGSALTGLPSMLDGPPAVTHWERPPLSIVPDDSLRSRSESLRPTQFA